MKVLYLAGRRAKELPLLQRGHAEVEVIHCYGGQFRAVDGGSVKGTQLPTIAKHFCPDVVLIEGPGWYGIAGQRAAAAIGAPTAVRVKGMYWKEGNDWIHRPWSIARTGKLLWNQACASRCVRAADYTIPISVFIRNAMLARKSCEIASSAVVGNPVPEVPVGADTKAPLDAFLLTITNFNFWPKAHSVIEVAHSLADAIHNKEASWHILGGGTYLPFVRRALQSYSNIHVVGHADPWAYLVREPIALVHPTSLDGLPNSILEAWATDTPVLLNGCSPVAEFAINGLARAYPGDLVSFQAEILDMIENPRETRQQGQRAGKMARDRFSLDNCSQSLLAALEESMNLTPSRSRGLDDGR